MKNILFLDHARALGGAERSLLYILEKLDRDFWRPYLGCRPGALPDAARNLGVETIELELPRLRRSIGAVSDLLEVSRNLADIIAEKSIDIFYANTVRAAIYGSITARRVNRIFIWHMREFWLSENQPRLPVLDHLIKRVIGGSADLILANSNAMAAHLPFRRKIRVVHNGIDPDRFSLTQDPREAKAKFSIPEGSPVIGVVGRLRPIKGFDRFLQVAAQVAAARPDVFFLIVGGAQFNIGDRYEETLPLIAGELQIADRVVLTGHLEDIRPALSAIDIFVNPGDPEAFGLVNIEAMAMGLPVIAYAHGAMVEIVEPGKTGLLVPSGNEEALARAILKLLHTPEYSRLLGAEGRKRMEKFFSANRMVSQISDILKEISDNQP